MAKVNSIGWDIRMWILCSAGKSWKDRRGSRSFKRHSGFWGVGLVGFKKRVERFPGGVSPFRHPNLMKAFLGLLLKRIPKVVANIECLVDPGPLGNGLRKNLFKGASEPHGVITGRKSGG
ncbi:hypothetical protein Y981_05975 [Leptospirillum ferriphilum YSK]|uniref:Uncharacterized protein n=1 Tax=Leptospirillum ferriphilum YSK TaxID=1441628 RepID=A0A059XX56_9BACT|nr:hypothetical protein Y981_05975 [Leptospirillum ferriphilum YSK]